MTQFQHVFFFIIAFLFFGACGNDSRPPVNAKADKEDKRSGSLNFTDVTHSAGLGNYVHVTGAFGKKLFPETMAKPEPPPQQ